MINSNIQDESNATLSSLALGESISLHVGVALLSFCCDLLVIIVMMMMMMMMIMMVQVILGVYSKTRFSTNINLALANTKGVILAVRLALLVLHLIIVQVMMMMIMMMIMMMMIMMIMMG